jgi:hypothetical protein
MRKPRDYDAKLKSLEDKTRDLKSRKVQQLGELVIATGADGLSADELAGALIVLAETKEAAKREAWAKRATAIRRLALGMTCAPGRSSAVSVRGTSSNSVVLSSRPASWT